MTTARALVLAVAVGAAATGVAFGADDDAPLLPAEAAASLGSTDPAAIGAPAAAMTSRS